MYASIPTKQDKKRCAWIHWTLYKPRSANYRSLRFMVDGTQFIVNAMPKASLEWHSLQRGSPKFIGRARLAHENEAVGSWGKKVRILHVLFFVVKIELFQSNYFSNTVRRIITSRSSGTLCRWQWSRKSWILIDYNGGCNGNSGKYLRLTILTNNEKCHFSRSATCLGQTHTCYNYANLDNLSDRSAYRNHNVQQCKMQIP